MTISKEIIEHCEIIEQRLLELSSTQAFRYRAKASAKKNLYSILNIGIELKHALIMGGDPNSEAVVMALEFINKNYCKLYTSRNKVRNTIYEPEKEF
jgi:hypothetical protein